MNSLPIFAVLEPVSDLAALLREQVSGWEIKTFADRQALLAALPMQAVLLAMDEPGLVTRLRDAGMIGPIFMIGEAAPGAIGLAQPLRLGPLLARLEAPGDSAIDQVPLGAWRLDASQHALVDGERQEHLTDREFDILRLLLVNRGRAVPREELLRVIWQYHPEADSHTVETHIWRLRQKLEDDPTVPVLLLTTADGYQL